MLSRQFVWRAVEQLCLAAALITVTVFFGVASAACLAVGMVLVGRGIGSRDTPYLLPTSVDPSVQAPVDTLQVR